MTRKRTNPEISLFPFLSVLCSVIGVLLLFVVLVLSTRVIAVEEERFRETEEYRRQPAPGRTGVVEEGIDDRSFKELESQITQLRELLKERQERRESLTAKLASLEDLIEFKKTEFLIPVKAVRPPEFDKPVPVAVVPDDGYKETLRPIFVEVTNQYYIVQPSQKTFPVINFKKDTPQSQPVATSELTRFLRELNPNKEYLVFLIHPNGVGPFDGLRAYITERFKNLRVGWEPFSRNWVFANEAQK